MLMRCNFKTILRGDVVKPGTVLDLTKEECAMDVVKKSFTKVAGGAGAKAPGAADGQGKDAIVVAGLTRAQAMLKLQEAGAKVQGNISNKLLAELYNQTFANLAEASAAQGGEKNDGGEAKDDEGKSEDDEQQSLDDLANS